MATAHASNLSSLLSSFLPRLSSPALVVVSRSTTLYSRQFLHPFLPALSLSIPLAVHLSIPTLLRELWDGLLKAVPKKKTSYQKKRSRFLAGKGLKDVTSLNRCSSCGNIKRAHLLCPYCVAEVKKMFKKSMTSSDTSSGQKPSDGEPTLQ